MKDSLWFRLVALVIVSHLESCPAEAAFHIEALVCLAAVQNRFVAADLLSNEIEGLDYTQAQLFPLLILGYCNILDVTNETKVVDAGEDQGQLCSHKREIWQSCSMTGDCIMCLNALERGKIGNNSNNSNANGKSNGHRLSDKEWKGRTRFSLQFTLDD